MSVLVQRYDGEVVQISEAHRSSIDGEHVAHHGEVTAATGIGKGRVRQPTPALPISTTNDYNCLFCFVAQQTPTYPGSTRARAVLR